ncbi:scavenger receptor cysteine-rich domain superfamily protein-like [Saccoglossus kowalevskii]|uniref:Scavenger receptor cysteine-rich domain superfamily protein-like n=1 Tax=Saccoglossus kowalevskii TaxID=10224 RepID=A0ABM0MGN4_SACKO|nr:PREDICTED: scavenger receptor cysteine-rich domain superfamily protein-like [Saccoglossus kowalevskii]
MANEDKYRLDRSTDETSYEAPKGRTLAIIIGVIVLIVCVIVVSVTISVVAASSKGKSQQDIITVVPGTATTVKTGTINTMSKLTTVTPTTQPIPRSPLRLFGGNDTQGGVEVWQNDQWIAICGLRTDFTYAEAKVICRHLDIRGGASPRYNSHFGHGSATSSFVLKNLHCHGNEQTIDQCEWTISQDVSCLQYFTVGVVCGIRADSLAVRYEQGNLTKGGYIQVFRGASWDTLLLQGWHESWDTSRFFSTAVVACHQLGHGRDVQYIYQEPKYLGPRYLQMVCHGTESSLAECIDDGYTDFYTQFPMTVECDYIVEQFDLRLMDGIGDFEGGVAISANGVDGLLCYEDMKNPTRVPNVICTELDLGGDPSSSVNYLTNFNQDMQTTDILAMFLVRDWSCKGSESNIRECSTLGFIEGTLQEWNYPCVQPRLVCNLTSIDIRLVNGRNVKEGKVEVSMNRLPWMGMVAVAGSSSNFPIVGVICRELGYQHEAMRVQYQFGDGTLERRQFNCDGDETALIQCSDAGMATWGSGQSINDLQVVCNVNMSTFDVRLVGGSTANEGRLEVSLEDIWGTVCHTYGFGHEEAVVVCKELGFGYSSPQVVYARTDFGVGTADILMQSVNCHGNETSLAQCDHNGWGFTSCQHSTDVGLICL